MMGNKFLVHPTSQVATLFEEEATTTSTEHLDEAPVLSNSYYFSFLNDNARYMLAVNGEAAEIAELQRSFLNVLPILFVAVIIIALAFAWLYSCIITKPILKISRIAREMSDMKLDWRFSGQNLMN